MQCAVKWSWYITHMQAWLCSVQLLYSELIVLYCSCAGMIVQCAVNWSWYARPGGHCFRGCHCNTVVPHCIVCAHWYYFNSALKHRWPGTACFRSCPLWNAMQHCSRTLNVRIAVTSTVHYISMYSLPHAIIQLGTKATTQCKNTFE